MSKKLIIIIISIITAIFIFTILSITLISGLTAYFVSRSVGKTATSGVQEEITDNIIKQASTTYFTITPDFNANTADVDITRYIKVKVILTYTDNAEELDVELSERIYMIKDIIYAIIRAYTFEQLRTNEGIEKLKIEIKNEINGILKNGKIDDVLFVDLTLN